MSPQLTPFLPKLTNLGIEDIIGHLAKRNGDSVLSGLSLSAGIGLHLI